MVSLITTPVPFPSVLFLSRYQLMYSKSSVLAFRSPFCIPKYCPVNPLSISWSKTPSQYLVNLHFYHTKHALLSRFPISMLFLSFILPTRTITSSYRQHFTLRNTLILAPTDPSACFTTSCALFLLTYYLPLAPSSLFFHSFKPNTFFNPLT